MLPYFPLITLSRMEDLHCYVCMYELEIKAFQVLHVVGEAFWLTFWRRPF